jgi:hypothetical protein
MNVHLEPKEIELLATQLESTIQELRGLIASGMRKDMRDDIRKDKLMLMDILEKVKMAAVAEKEKVAKAA